MRETAKAGDHGMVALRLVQLLGIAQRAHERDAALLVGEILAMLEGQIAGRSGGWPAARGRGQRQWRPAATARAAGSQE